MQQYLSILEDVLYNGDTKGPARAGMPSTKEVFFRTMAFNMELGLPVVTTKKMYIKGAIAELLWLLKGSTNIKSLVDQGANQWNDDAYKYYVRQTRATTREPDLFSGPLSKEDWLEKVKLLGADSPSAVWGATGNTYGHQWRNWNGSFDQIQAVLDNLRNKPNSRYHVVTAWNPFDYLNDPNGLRAALPACHVYFQFNIRQGRYLDLMMLQRSCDMFLGVPFDLVMYSVLIHIFANILNLTPGEFIWTGNSCHIYENQIEAVKTQLQREPFDLPTLRIARKLTNVDDLKLEDFIIEDYECHEAIKAPLSVGL